LGAVRQVANLPPRLDRVQRSKFVYGLLVALAGLSQSERSGFLAAIAPLSAAAPLAVMLVEASVRQRSLDWFEGLTVEIPEGSKSPNARAASQPSASSRAAVPRGPRRPPPPTRTQGSHPNVLAHDPPVLTSRAGVVSSAALTSLPAHCCVTFCHLPRPNRSPSN
jgi:hypothetical protein